MSKALDYRRYVARKLWRSMCGWSYPHWTLSKRDESVIAYWDKHGHIERSGNMMRLTDAGKLALTNGELQK